MAENTGNNTMNSFEDYNEQVSGQFFPDDAGETFAENVKEDEKTAEDDDEDHHNLLQMYLEELETVKPLKDSEVETATRDRLIEGNLKPALSYLYDYVNKGVDLGEMIAQANLALTEAIDSFVKNGRNGKLASIVEKAVKDSINELIEESGETRLANEQLAERLNTLSDVSVELVEEYGRQPTNAELAHRLNTTEDEIERLLKMSMNAL